MTPYSSKKSLHGTVLVLVFPMQRSLEAYARSIQRFGGELSGQQETVSANNASLGAGAVRNSYCRLASEIRDRASHINDPLINQYELAQRIKFIRACRLVMTTASVGRAYHR